MADIELATLTFSRRRVKIAMACCRALSLVPSQPFRDWCADRVSPRLAAWIMATADIQFGRPK